MHDNATTIEIQRKPERRGLCGNCKVCPCCKVSFKPRRSRVLCCSKRCANLHARGKTISDWSGKSREGGICANPECRRETTYIHPRGLCMGCYRFKLEIRDNFPTRPRGRKPDVLVAKMRELGRLSAQDERETIELAKVRLCPCCGFLFRAKYPADDVVCCSKRCASLHVRGKTFFDWKGSKATAGICANQDCRRETTYLRSRGLCMTCYRCQPEIREFYEAKKRGRKPRSPTGFLTSEGIKEILSQHYNLIAGVAGFVFRQRMPRMDIDDFKQEAFLKAYRILELTPPDTEDVIGRLRRHLFYALRGIKAEKYEIDFSLLQREYHGRIGSQTIAN